MLHPSEEANTLILGVIGRAQRRHQVEIVYFTFMSSHFHMLAIVQDVEQIANFMRDVKSQIAREIGALQSWTGTFWSGRYSMIEISDESEAQVARLRYCLAQGVKEGLVEKVEDWPGVQAASHLLTDAPLEGVWFNRTRKTIAHYKGCDLSQDDCMEKETVTLSRLPCWKHHTDEEYRQAVLGLVEEIEASAKAMHKLHSTKAAGGKSALQKRQLDRPRDVKHSPCPVFHAFKRSVRDNLLQAYRLFEAAFREAARKLRNGHANVTFPQNCFPPATPFVGVRLCLL